MRTEIAVLDSTLQKTIAWLNDLSEELGWQDRQKAYSALRAALHALRDRLGVNEAVDLGSQFPILIAGLYYHGWSVNDKPLKLHRQDFLDRIRDAFPNDPDLDAERVAKAVFRILEDRITAGEIQDVKATLPKDLQQLWADAVGHA